MRGQTVNYHLNSVTKSISIIFKSYFVRLLKNESYNTYQTGFSFRCWVMTQRCYLWGTGGSGSFFQKFNQIWCVSYSHRWHMKRHHVLGPRSMGTQRGTKRSNIIKFQLQSQFQRFLYQALCIFSQMKYIKRIRWDFNSVTSVLPKGWYVKKLNFLNMVMWHIKLKG